MKKVLVTQFMLFTTTGWRIGCGWPCTVLCYNKHVVVVMHKLLMLGRHLKQAAEKMDKYGRLGDGSDGCSRQVVGDYNN